MSWPHWSAGAQPAVPSVLNPSTSVLNSAPAVAPPGLQYTPEQWAQLQQQNWNQWAQWQQQYQQWHQQYGAEYQKSMNALAQAAQAQQHQQQLSALPNVAIPPPLPTETKPPLPVEDPPPTVPSYSTAPPPTPQGYNTLPVAPQGYATALPIPQSTYNAAPPPLSKSSEHRPPVHYPKSSQNQNWQGQNYPYRNDGASNKRPFDQGPDPEPKRPMLNKPGWQSQPPPAVQPQPRQANIEELSEAEKKFDKQFAEWEAQFNKWKEQNAEHPDKTQYKEYEKKWEMWRAQLLERREQMRRKRLGLTAGSPNMNRPSSGQTNQTYGSSQQGYNQSVQRGFNQPQHGFNQPLSQTYSQPPPQGFNQPPPKTLANTSLRTGELSPTSPASFSKPPPNLNDEPLKFKDSKLVSDPGESRGDFIKPNTQGGIPGLDLVTEDSKPLQRDNDDVVLVDPDEKEREKRGPDFDAISKGINTILGDKNLMNMLSKVSQNQNPVAADNLTTTVSAIRESSSTDQNSQQAPYPEQSNQSYDEHSNHSGSFGQREFVNNFDDQTRSSFTHGEQETRFGQNQDRFGIGQDKVGSGLDKFSLNQEKCGVGQSKFGPGQDRFGLGPNRFGSGQDRHGSNSEQLEPNRYDSKQERFGLNQNRFGPNQEKSGPNQDRYGRFGFDQDRNKPGQDRFVSGPDRFGLNQDRFGSNQSRFGLGQDKFGCSLDRFSSNQDRLGQIRERFGPNQSKFGQDRSAPSLDKAGAGQDRFSSQQDKFGSNQDRIGLKEDRYGGLRTDDRFSSRSDRNRDDYEQDYVNFEDPSEEKISEPPWNKEKDYHSRKYGEPTLQAAPEAPLLPPQSEDIFQPATVIDYDHKPLKSPEPEILVEPLFMFDYRHKPLSRIPLPQRPKWLSETVKHIREFDPPTVRQYEPPSLRRYSSSESWRSDRYQDSWSPHNRRGYNDSRPPFDDRRSYQDNRSYEDNRSKNEWNASKHEERRSYNQERNSYNEERKPLFASADFEEEKISDTEWPKDLDDAEPQQNSQSNSDFGKFQSPSENKSNSKSAVLIEDLINPPGRYKRPPRIVIILRGPPGSGKTFLAKLIKDKEVENGGSAPRILSLDDYFMVEQEKEITEEGKKVKVKEMVYEYEAEMEEAYRSSLIKSFKKTITDGYFSFIIVDNVNDKVKYFGEMWSFAKQNGFQVYICQLDLDVQTCSKRNIHGRSETDIEKCVSNWETTPPHHPLLDATCLLQSASIPEVEMEEVNSPESDTNEHDGSEDQVARSKWDNFDCSVDNLAKLDGVSKPLRHRTMEEYLQLDNDWTPNRPTKPGQKRVRWADLEEQKEQEKMRAIGFVVGHTNWDRMMDPTGGSSALTQTKYIEKIGRYKVDPK